MMRRVLPFLLLAFVTPVLFAKGKPWRFAPGEKAEAERTYGKLTWNRHYSRAQELLDGGKSVNLDEVIAILKLAIDLNGRSERDVVIKRMPMDYFPYYLLAEAYARAGDARAAQECLQEESAGLIRQSNSLGPKYNALAGSITALVSKDEVLAQARNVLGWRGTDTATVLGPDFQQSIAGIEAKVSEVEKSGPQQLQPRLDALNAALLDLCKKSIAPRAGLIDELGKAPWSVPGVAGSCAPVGGDASVAGVKAAIKAVETCVAGVTTGVRTAGRKACDEIDGLMRQVKKLAESSREWHARSKKPQPELAPPPEAPGACAGWDAAPLATALASFDRLKENREKSVEALETQRAALSSAIAARRGELEQRLTAARRQIPAIQAQCASDLPIGKARTTLNNLRKTLDPGRIPAEGVPSQEVFDAPERVSQTLAALRAGLESAVQSLVQEGDLPDMDRASFDQLAARLDTCLSRGDDCEIAPICDAARTAKATLGRYYQENEAALRAVLDDYNQRLIALGPRDADLECLSAARDDVGRLLSARRGGDAASWSEQASAARNAASTCIMTFRERADAKRAELLPQIQDAQEMLTSLKSVCGGPQGMTQLKSLCDQMATLGSALDRNKTALDELAALYQGEKPEACGSIVETLDRPALTRYAPPDAAVFLTGSPDGRPGSAAERCLVARDATVFPLVQETTRLLARHRRTLTSLGPIASLIGAFDAFDRGDLDAAILRLRRASSQGRIPAAGRETAYVHAALAYFLHAKRLLLAKAESDGALIALLDEDLGREMEKAHRADETFRPPESMFRNASFRKDFEARIADGTRRGES